MVAFDGHVKKCRKLRPAGANGWGPGAAAGAASQEATRLAKKAESLEDRMRALFDRFDSGKTGALSAEDLATCIRQCFPSRPDDAASLVAEFSRADKDGSGGVEFEEFCSYYNELASSGTRFDEAADMFRKFDVGAWRVGAMRARACCSALERRLVRCARRGCSVRRGSATAARARSHASPSASGRGRPRPRSLARARGAPDKSDSLSKGEFLALLNQVFPEHCDEIEEIFEREWAIADADGSGSISYNEFCAYFDRLRGLFEVEEADGEDELDGDLVPCDGCGLTFLPSKLETHRRSCKAVKALDDARAAQLAAEAKLAATLAELEAARLAAEAATKQATDDAAAANANASDADAAKKAADAEARRKAKEAAKAAKAAEAQAAKAAADAENEQARAAGLTDSFTPTAFVACKDCGRKFFPDRLPVHARVCSKRKPNLCRETVTDGRMIGSMYVTSVGMYGNEKDAPAM
jgi:Ca2+-binding EF-hand superfamily protein